ncbi:MAG: sulfotransferase [Bacteroidales bacterium]|nr:sulfotransferase [Bacteroidales bacterium]
MSTILHIGYPKTATSWLQEKYYPKITNRFLVPRKTLQKYFLEPGAFEFDVENTGKIFNEFSDKPLLLSDELLLGRLRPGGVKGFVTKEVANRLHKVFPDARVVLFIRNQIDMVASSYLQYVRSGGNYSIRRFMFPEDYEGSRSNRTVLLGLDYFLYHQVIDYYKQLFGDDQVDIYLYEDFDSDPKSFIQNFNDKYSFDCDISKIDFTRVNPGYRKFLIHTRRFSSIFSRMGPLNKYYLFHIKNFDYISRYFHYIANNYKIFGGRPDSKKLIGRKNLKRVEDYYRESNRMLTDKYNLNQIEKYNYPL